MRTSFTFARILGIPIKLHVNWLITAVLVVFSLAIGYFPQEYPGWEPRWYWVVSLATSLLFFSSVLLHELGHAWVALREGVPVNSITLFIFGGVAHIGHEPGTPGAEFRIVAAGPLASVFLAIFFGLFAAANPFGSYWTGAAVYLMQVNVILAVFNLLPGFPLDGGRLLRAMLWKAFGSFRLATRWAANTGIAIAILFVLAGLVVILATGNVISGLWIAFVGWYLSTAAQEGYRQSVANDPTEPEGFDPALEGGLSPSGAGMRIMGRRFSLAHVYDPRDGMAYIRRPRLEDNPWRADPTGRV